MNDQAASFSQGHRATYRQSPAITGEKEDASTISTGVLSLYLIGKPEEVRILAVTGQNE